MHSADRREKEEKLLVVLYGCAGTHAIALILFLNGLGWKHFCFEKGSWRWLDVLSPKQLNPGEN
jgi:hypothetical protein